MGFNLLTFRYILRRKSPVFLPSFSLPTKQDLTSNLVIGSGIFGVGWGLAGVCPGPGLVGLTTGDPLFTLWAVSMMGGMKLYQRLSRAGWLKERALFGKAAAAA